jgi:DNA-binding NtrC family response regulator
LRVDVRLIAATNRDIVEAIRQNQFREDLFHRLNVMQLRPPPLRDRGRDVLLLANHFLRHFSATMNKSIRVVSPAAQDKLLAHHWPGNVRELRNVMERAVILEPTEEIQSTSLPMFRIETRLRKTELPSVPGNRAIDEVMSEFEKELILNSLEQNRYSLTRTADQLKISRHALRYRMQRLNINTGHESEDDAPQSTGKETAPCT